MWHKIIGTAGILAVLGAITMVVISPAKPGFFPDKKVPFAKATAVERNAASKRVTVPSPPPADPANVAGASLDTIPGE